MMSPIELSGPMLHPRRWLRVKRKDTARTFFLRAALAFISVHQRSRKTALRARSPLIPPAPYSPCRSTGGEGGPSGVRCKALGVRGTAKQPDALYGTFH
jgi:hypothetical protein